MYGKKYRQLIPARRIKDQENLAEKSSPSCEVAEVSSYRDKSLDMSVRLELWRAKKRKQQSSKETNKTIARNNSSSGSKSDILLTKTAKLLNKKFQTPVKEYQSPSIKDTFKDTNLAMRTRLDLWLKDKGKIPQSPTLSKQRFSKTPVGTTPNQRRKTCCYSQLNNKSHVTTPRRSGILKNKNLTGKQTKNFIPRSKENWSALHGNVGVSPEPSNSLSSSYTLALQEEEVLTQSLEKCYRMFNENVSAQEEIVFSLDDIQRDHPNALRHSLYWICRAKLAEYVGDHERVVCMIEQASAFSAQPEELVQKYFDEYSSRKQIEDKKEFEQESSKQNTAFRTPHKTPSRELSKLDGEVFNSSVVRFCLIDSTPVRNRRKSAPEKRVLTPVRRTTRWERCGITHPKTIEENRMTVASLDELTSQIRSSIVYRPNSLLPCQLDEEMRILENIDEF